MIKLFLFTGGNSQLDRPELRMNLNTAMTCCSAGRLDEWMELAGSTIPPQEEQQQPPRYEEYITVKQQWMAQVRDWGRGT